jgi:hypothetical protein
MTLVLPIALLGAVAFAGLAIASVLGSRLPADARAALAIPAGAALFACASPFVVIGVPARWLALGCIAIGGIPALLLRAQVLPVVRAAGVPVLLAVVSVAALAVPWAVEGSWEAATYGNADPYLWVSQARAYLDDPPPSPATEYLDRQAYEKITRENWPTALPFGVASVAAAARADPVESYSAFAVLLGALLTLVAYFTGRALFDWTPRKAAAGALVASLSGYLLFATWYGWQAQVGLTAFALLSLASFRLALERGGLFREAVAAGIFAAAAMATYGSLFGAFVPAFVAVLVAYALALRRIEPRPVGRVLLISLIAAIGAGFVPATRALRSLGTLDNSLAVPDWERYAHGHVAEAIGLMPRSVDLGRPSLGWSIVATAAAFTIGLVLWDVVRSGRASELGNRSDFLLGTCTYFLAMLLILRLPPFSPYVSMKIAGYGAAFLTLTAFAALTVPRPRHWATSRLSGYTRIAAVFLFATATGVTYLSAFTNLRGSHSYEALRGRVPAQDGALVAVDVADAWRQSWILYYLRDRRIVLRKPSTYIVGAGSRAARARSATVVIRRGRTRTDAWEDGTLDVLVCERVGTKCTPVSQ